MLPQKKNKKKDKLSNVVKSSDDDLPYTPSDAGLSSNGGESPNSDIIAEDLCKDTEYDKETDGKDNNNTDKPSTGNSLGFMCPQHTCQNCEAEADDNETMAKAIVKLNLANKSCL